MVRLLGSALGTRSIESSKESAAAIVDRLSLATMMMRSLLLSLLLILFSSPAQALFDCFKCPTDMNLNPKCLINVLPPWPICLLYDIDYFVAKAVDASTRCCGDDISKCHCPKKDTDDFKSRIGDWCAGVATCPQTKAAVVVEEVELDMEESVVEVEEALE